MELLRGITGLVRVRGIGPGALVTAATGVLAVVLAVLVRLSVAEGSANPSCPTWRAHHEACHAIPDEAFHRDRFRAVEGRVTDADGQPVAGATVRCVRLESLVGLAANAGPPSPSGWSPPIETETRTDAAGRYAFPHLPIGGRTLFYSAPPGRERELAPAVKDLVVVQDGLGARLDVTLTKPARLLVRFRTPTEASMRLYLVPRRWWPELETTTIPAAWRGAEFRHVGGPFRKGLIAREGRDASSPLRIIGRYDLDRSAEVELWGHELTITRLDLPEAAGIEPWRFEPSTDDRAFYATMSPIPLFWPDSPTGWPSSLPVPRLLDRLGISYSAAAPTAAELAPDPARWPDPDPSA
ncbi:MAG: carboxypeptidase-like regulatory domain-containing protein, partial [Isosphaeraceae bacterium]